MFENKKEPQDIFEGVEPPANLPVAGAAAPTPTAPAGAAAPRVTPPTATPSARPVPVMPSSPDQIPDAKLVADRHLATGGHLWKTVLIVVIAFLAMGGAAFMAFRFMNPPDKGAVEDRDGQTQGESDEGEIIPDGKGGEGNTVQEVPDVEIVVDTDGDGLNNPEEQAAGTNVSKPDTDSDLLGDREEVQVYGTDPLRVDTDDDGYTDGQEVRSGYNPNGPGKILEIPTN